MRLLTAAIMLVVLMLAGVSLACDDSPVCPEVTVTCNCSSESMELPGLWEVMVAKELRCGKITVFGSGFTIEEVGEHHGKQFFVINKLKRATQVEACEGRK